MCDHRLGRRGRTGRRRSGCGRSGRSSSTRRPPAAGGRGGRGSWSRTGRARTARPRRASIGDGASMPSRKRARTMPSWIWFAVPSANTSTTAMVKSVSSALVAAYSTAVIGPVSSRSSVSGGVVYVSTSSRRSSSRRSPSASAELPAVAADGLGDRVGGVVVVQVGRLVSGRRLHREHAAGAQVVGGRDGRARRPRVELLPAVAEREDLDRRHRRRIRGLRARSGRRRPGTRPSGGRPWAARGTQTAWSVCSPLPS